MSNKTKSRVLIVDDTPANIKILADLLRGQYMLSVATSGPDALRIAQSDDRPDLILLDIMMPGMDGYEVCRQLKAQPKTSDVPVIFVTAMNEVEDETRGFELGAVDYITKPIRPAIVQARVAAQLELALSRKVLERQNQELSDSLRVAAEVQRTLLPKCPPTIPGLDIAGCCIPCDAVGGDYMDYLAGQESGGRGFAFVIADVSGHGPASALLMAAARASLRMRMQRPGTLAEVLTEMNVQLTADLDGTWRFVTMLLMAYDKGVLSWSVAGHDPALLVDPISGTVRELPGTGMVLGMDGHAQFDQFSMPMAGAGTVLVLSTDGVNEAANAAGEQFGRDRLRAALMANASLSAQGILDAVVAEQKRFCGDVPRNDDLTMLVLKLT